ncbi:class I SAM-dependent methyltransferase [Bradyrhizobium sp. SRS-191]|uniref:class I SAM-dependent methyltransferase n=1 Tax=Bradyrhizobium sp. SRS-191 TaxID=2962606 RepID=UPI00211EFCA7|nr:class I SAM-dependent methyltransferase [Bradyrhizobium sp. SRS-191]
MKKKKLAASPGNRARGDVAPSGRFASLDPNKLRGGYYTSSEVADWLSAWAIRKRSDIVLEPSCGDGAFLVAAAKRFFEIGAKKSDIASRLKGVEILAAAAEQASARLVGVLGKPAGDIVINSDFFDWWRASVQPSCDVVIGNPPFIRYQSFPEPHRSHAMAMMQDQGLSPNRLTNIWVPFVVAAACSLRAGGRMAFVLPAELLQVSYAAQLRSFLTDRFRRIDIVACNELFFENAEQEVVLLLADDAVQVSKTNICRVAMTEADTVAEITKQNPTILLEAAQPKVVAHDNEKWLKYFLTPREITFMRELRETDKISAMAKHASIDVGIVTGKNEFFVLSEEQVTTLGLEGHTIPLVSRSVQLKGSRLGKSDWKSLSAAGDRVHLLNITTKQAIQLNAALRNYISEGEKKDFHKGYKCSIRTPWYSVPSVWKPDGFMFRQIYDFPRIVLNNSDATSTDTIHRFTCKADKPERVIANTYTWLTAASAEIEGRSYGGGVLELEPTEAERLMMPAQLNGAMPLIEADRLIRAGQLDAVLEENARIVLRHHLGLSSADCTTLRNIWIKMRDRRMARRRGARAKASQETA